jgi:micrococcal nuclease
MRRPLLLLVVLAGILPAAACEDEGGGGRDRATEHRDTIARVTDGDTVVLERLGRTRLIGIDTPEVYPVEECFGRAAAERMEQLVPRGTRVRYAFDTERRDRYGRALVFLFEGDAQINAELVGEGYARPLRVPPNTSQAERFDRLANDARRHDRGLWSRC